MHRLLGKDDIDTTGNREGARGGGGKHVEMEQAVKEKKAKSKQQAGGELDLNRRLAALTSMVELNTRLQQKYANLRDAFRSIDVDSDNTLSYTEFGQVVIDWMPELNEEKARDICRLLDADGDGMIDFEEFSTALSANSDDMRKGTSGTLRHKEQKQVANMQRSKGRFGATPTFAYGVQMAELISSFPGAASYLAPSQRFAPSVSHQVVPDWQIADASRRANKAVARREIMRFHTQRQEAVAASRQRAAEVKHDGRMASLITQRQRYDESVAKENWAGLRPPPAF